MGKAPLASTLLAGNAEASDAPCTFENHVSCDSVTPKSISLAPTDPKETRLRRSRASRPFRFFLFFFFFPSSICFSFFVVFNAIGRSAIRRNLRRDCPWNQRQARYFRIGRVTARFTEDVVHGLRKLGEKVTLTAGVDNVPWHHREPPG